MNNLGWGTGQPTQRICVRGSLTQSDPLPVSTAGWSFLNPSLQPRKEKPPLLLGAKYSVWCLVRQMFHLLGQLAASPRKTSSTGFLFLFLPLQGWGKRLSLRFDPPLPSLAALPRWLGPIAAPRTCPGWRRAARPGPGCAEPRRARGRAPRTVAARGGGRAGHRAGGGGRRAEV